MLPIGVIGSLVALGAPLPPLLGHRTSPAAVVGDDGVVRRDPVHDRPADLVRGLVGRANQPTWMTILQNVSVFSFGLIPIAIGVSVLRYHLFDIDVVINRALLYGTIAVVITAVYVGDRRRDRRARGQPGRADPVGRCGGDHRDRVPAVADAGAAVRRPAGLRRTRRAVRGALRVLGTAREHVRERPAAAPDGRRARRRHRRDPGGCLGPYR